MFVNLTLYDFELKDMILLLREKLNFLDELWWVRLRNLRVMVGSCVIKCLPFFFNKSMSQI